MPGERTIKKARRDRRAGKSASTQAGEFVRDEIDKIRRGKHGARSTKQAIAIGLSEARRAGVDLPPPKRGQTTERTRKSAEYAYEAGQGRRKAKRRPRVARAVSRALKREPRTTVSRKALSRQAQAVLSFHHGGLEIDATVTRADFETWIADDLAQLDATIDRVLEQAALPETAVDHVFLTGGTSFVPAVRALFDRRFGRERVQSGGEFVSVAEGLALIGRDRDRARPGSASAAA